jgi:two-component system, OmpR family, phosphate regulon sensor histidine kinase PhoR
VATLVLASPAAAALLGLVAAGLLAPLAAVAGGLAAVVVAGALAAWHRRRLRLAARQVEALLEEGAAPPAIALGDAELERALRRLGRRLAEQRERRHALDRLQQSLLDALPDPVLLLDREMTIRRGNRAAMELLGGGLGERPLVMALRDPGLLAAVGDALGHQRESALALTLSGPARRAFAVRVVPVVGDDGVTAALVSLRERTEELQIEQMRTDFVAHASHELRTPLTAIRGFIETLRGPARDDPPARERFLAIMAAEAERMTRLLGDLLSLSRIEQLEHSPPETRASVGDVLGTVARTLGDYAGERGVRIELELAEGLPPVRGDADQLHQVFANLVDNAIKYGGEGKAVSVRALSLESAPPGAGPLAGRPAVAIAVIDRGEGVPRELLPRLTERFFRVDSARSRRLGGTGLGLAIVKHAIRRHRGHLAIDSEPGKGSTFTVYLPLG